MRPWVRDVSVQWKTDSDRALRSASSFANQRSRRPWPREGAPWPATRGERDVHAEDRAVPKMGEMGHVMLLKEGLIIHPSRGAVQSGSGCPRSRVCGGSMIVRSAVTGDGGQWRRPRMGANDKSAVLEAKLARGHAFWA